MCPRREEARFQSDVDDGSRYRARRRHDTQRSAAGRVTRDGDSADTVQTLPLPMEGGGCAIRCTALQLVCETFSEDAPPWAILYDDEDVSWVPMAFGGVGVARVGRTWVCGHSLHFTFLLFFFFLHLLLSPDTYFCLCSHLPCPCCRRDECLSPLDLGRLWERGRGFSSFIIRYSKFHVWVAGLLGQCRYPGFFWSGREECRFTRYRWRGGTGWGRGGSRATALGGHCT